MIGRQIVGGVVGLGAMSIFAAGIVWSGHPHRAPSSNVTGPPLVERLNTERPIDRRWSVTHALSFHRVMVVDVETLHVDESRAFAERIVEPVRPLDYDEILIYFRQTPNRKAPAERRVQWTPHDGFVELNLAGTLPRARP